MDGAVTVEKEAKLKTALELGDFLTTVAAVVEESLAVAAEYHGSDVDANEAPDHHVEVVKWLQIKSVLEKEKFSGAVFLYDHCPYCS